ncbi:phage tail protein [Alsobacter sp. R-9]
MALTIFNPPLPPSVGLKRRPEVKLLKAEFGDGYTQIARDGINHIRMTVELQWDALTATQAVLILNFLEERGGDQAFLYTPPGFSTARKWRCEEWEDTAISANGYRSVRAVLREDFNASS